MILLHRKDSIINSTIAALSELGIQNLSTKEIAKREGVSEGTLFRHYKNKSEILLAVLDHYSQFDDDIIQTCVNRKLTSIDAIRNYFLSYSEFYTNYPEITSILLAYDSLMCDQQLSDKVKSIINKRTNFIQKTIEKAIEMGELKENINSRYLTDLLVGGFGASCLRWRMEKHGFSLKERIVSMINMLLDGFANKK
jgi:AcrR family transcriptional regulator